MTRASVANAAWLAAALLAVAAAFVLPGLIGRYYTQMLALTGIAIIVGQGLNLLAGYAGQVSLGQAGFYAIGAYAGALVATRLGLGFWSGLPVAMAAAAVAGLLIAMPSFNLEGPYLSMVTIAFGIIVNSVLVEWSDLTGGTQGVLNIPRPTLFGERLYLEKQFVAIVAFAAVATLLLRNLIRSPWGRAFAAVRENPIAAQSVGLNTRFVKTVAFTFSAALAGLGGHLFAFLQGFISPEPFDLDASIFFLTAVIFGGAGTILGPIVGAPLILFLPELLQGFAEYRLIIYGVLIVVALYGLPLGVVGTLYRRSTLLPDLVEPGAAALGPDDGKELPAGTRDRRAVRLEDIRMTFGGVNALNGISFEVAPGSVHALIGPNGAGKTVLLNVLGGYYRPSSGRVRLGDEVLTGTAPHRVARRGIARTFQTAQLFGDLSVLQNVLIGFGGQTEGRMLDSLLVTPRLRREETARLATARRLLAFVGYDGALDIKANALPLGHQRLVEIARALALDPMLIVMDEPAAGLNPKEVGDLDRLIARIGERGISVLLVEHHMDLVMGISQTVTVLDHGEKLAEGPPAAIQADPAVVGAYLGTETVH